MGELFVVLNRTEARFFKVSPPKQTLKLIKRIENPIGRERNKGMQNDRPGADQFRIGSTKVSHALSGEKNPHEDAAIQFVRTIAAELKTESSKNNLETLIVAADPHMSGLLNSMLDKTTKKHVSSFIKKNLSKLTEPELRTLLQEKIKDERTYE